MVLTLGENIMNILSKGIKPSIQLNIFLLIELVLYFGFMLLDLFRSHEYILSSRIKFAGVVMCFLYALFFNKNVNSKLDVNIVKLALLFTVISDLFILILDYYSIGLITFCIVQLLYLVRMVLWTKPENLKIGILKKVVRNVSLVLIILIVLVFTQVKLETLIVLSSFYFVSIFLNVIDSIKSTIVLKDTRSMVFACGMILFLLCDINVGLFNLGDFILIDGAWFRKLYSFSSIAMWMFYLPSQVLITLSGKVKLDKD